MKIRKIKEIFRMLSKKNFKQNNANNSILLENKNLKVSILLYEWDVFGNKSIVIGINRKPNIVKSGEKTGINIKKAINEFLKYPFPDFVKLWVVIWRKKEKEPEIIDVRELIKPKIGGTDNE
jgi:hypothetical protein